MYVKPKSTERSYWGHVVWSDGTAIGIFPHFQIINISNSTFHSPTKCIRNEGFFLLAAVTI